MFVGVAIAGDAARRRGDAQLRHGGDCLGRQQGGQVLSQRAHLVKVRVRVRVRAGVRVGVRVRVRVRVGIRVRVGATRRVGVRVRVRVWRGPHAARAPLSGG